MKKLLFIPLLFISSIVSAAPSTTLSITPTAVDATVIEASDVNTRNSAVSTWANAHDHNDIDQTANTIAIGDATAGNKTIQANNADTNKPFIRYDDTNNRWTSSLDGTAIQSLVVTTGNTNGAFILPQTVSDNNHLIYNAALGAYEGGNNLADADGDTLIQVEESADEDIVRIDTNGTQRWIMTAAGERTMPTQPAFLVQPAGEQSNIAVGSAVDIVFGTEIFDQSSDFASNTFTAPVTGRYQINASILLGQVDTASGQYSIIIVTSNRNYESSFTPLFSGDLTWFVNVGVLVDMDANDTVKLTFTQTTGTQQTDISGSSFFSGRRL